MSEFGIYDLDAIEMMTLTEFNYRMYALEYQSLREEYERYKLAFAIRDAQAEQKKRGGKKGEAEYIFSNANEIIDYENNIERLNKGESIKFGKESKNDAKRPSKEIAQMIADINRG
ncbi:hypothetical protein [Staphylococcus saprophyticus]|uniref:hypothetical protein n=1 Tax=Staphylococcus saprophyticus TaxID=29385 RepID=UPI0022EB156D|nr:hypothetical protein [Staphylococcus saprophyticus]